MAASKYRIPAAKTVARKAINEGTKERGGDTYSNVRQYRGDYTYRFVRGSLIFIIGTVLFIIMQVHG